jgi:MFS family permease
MCNGVAITPEPNPDAGDPSGGRSVASPLVSSAADVLRQAPVRRYLTSTALGSVGHDLMVTVLFKQAFDTTHDELDIGLLGLAQFVPAVLLVLVSGWVADRFDRRRVAALFLLGRALGSVALMAYSASSSTKMLPLFAIAFVIGAADAMLAPSRRAMTPLITSAEDFPHVVALWTAVFTGSMIVGPVAGGLLYAKLGPTEAYAIAAALELLAIASVLAIRFVRTPERMTDRPTLAKAMEGLHFVMRTPIVLAAISLDLFAVLFGGAVALIPAVAEERLGVGDIAYGWLRAAPGIGAALMAIVLAVSPIRRRVGPTLLVVVAAFGAGTVVFGTTRSYVVAFIALVVISAADMVSMFIRGSLLPLATPDDQLGRVTAVEGVFIGASNELGAFESGVMARAVGLPWAIAGGGVITMAIAASFAWLFPSLRKIDTFDEVKPEPVGVHSS